LFSGKEVCGRFAVRVWRREVFAPPFAGSSAEIVKMRLDKYLKVSRLIKRRTVANDVCDAGRVSVNGRPAKASYEVKPGDVLLMQLGGRSLRVEVVSVQDTAAKAAAGAMYREVV
jgi:ribosomal 50S subunit-recycling heat shock protein